MPRYRRAAAAVSVVVRSATEGMSDGADAPTAHEARSTAIVRKQQAAWHRCMMSRAGSRASMWVYAWRAREWRNLVDAPALGAGARKGVGVRIPPLAPRVSRLGRERLTQLVPRNDPEHGRQDGIHR